MGLASIEAAVAPKPAHQSKPATRVIGEDLAGAWEGEFGGGISPAAAREPRLPCGATQIGRFRRLLGEDRLEQLFKATNECAVGMNAVRPAELERVIVDT